MAYLNNRYDSIHTTTTVVLYLSTQLLDLYLSIQFLCLYQDNCCAIIQIPVVPLSKTTIVTLYWQMSMLLPIETAIITLNWRLLSLYLTRQLLWFHPDCYYDYIQTGVVPLYWQLLYLYLSIHVMTSSRPLLWFHPDHCCVFQRWWRSTITGPTCSTIPSRTARTTSTESSARSGGREATRIGARNRIVTKSCHGEAAMIRSTRTMNGSDFSFCSFSSFSNFDMCSVLFSPSSVTRLKY